MSQKVITNSQNGKGNYTTSCTHGFAFEFTEEQAKLLLKGGSITSACHDQRVSIRVMSEVPCGDKIKCHVEANHI